jgi:hypothetical protein
MKTTTYSKPKIRRVSALDDGSRLIHVYNKLVDTWINDREHIIKGDIQEGSTLVNSDSEYCPATGDTKKIYTFEML